MGNKRFHKLVEEKLRADIEAGKTLVEIAEEVGCTKSRVSQVLRDFGIVRPDKYIGKRFGNLVVVRLAGKYRRANRYECLCDCGKSVTVIGWTLTKGNTKSCGCLSRRTGRDRPGFRGCGEISQTFWGRVEANASCRGLLVGVTVEQAWELYQRQGARCAYTGVELRLPRNSTDCRNGFPTASLDRIDSSKDYTPDNVQWVHKTINLMKSNLSEAEFIRWCRLVVERADAHLSKQEPGSERAG